MKLRYSAALVAALCTAPLAPVASLAFAQSSSPPAGGATLSDTDQKFVNTAATAGTTEIDAAKLALHRSSDKDVKMFAGHMIADHTKLAVQLKMAAPHGTELPKGPDNAALDALKPLKGADFDSAYLSKLGVQGHKEALAAFQDEADNGQNASLKKAAKSALPTIQHHYAMAQDLAKKKGIAVSE
jgi:predicted outer membrane protein